MKPLQQLYELADMKHKEKYPDMPDAYRYVGKFSDKTANGLTKCIIEWIRLNGGQAERISVQGRYIDSSKVITDVIGRQRKIGSGKYIPSSMQKGSADISSTIKGKSVKIEVKIGRDVQSEAQKEYQAQIERAGGIYLIAGSFEEFLNKYNKIVGY